MLLVQAQLSPEQVASLDCVLVPSLHVPVASHHPHPE